MNLAPPPIRRSRKLLRNSQDHMRKIRNRKLNHLFINIPSTIPKIFHSSRRDIQFGNKAGFLRKEITPLTSEITIHTKYDRTYRLFRTQSVHNSTI